MTLATRHDEKKLEKELYQKLNKQVTIFIILIGCLGAATATLITLIVE